MKKLLLAAVAAVALTALAGCPSGGTVPKTQKDCVAAGGHWSRGDSHHRPYCQPPASGW